MQLSKFLLCGAAGSIVTAGLGLFMVNLIHVDYEAKSAAQVLDFTIHPPLEEVDFAEQPSNIPIWNDDIEIPPPLERIQPEQATQPSEELVNVDAQLYEFEPPDLGPREHISIVVERPNPVPLIRFPGIMPDKALRDGLSGHCNMIFSVNAVGTTFDVKAKNCTNSMFESASIKAAKKFKYSPRLENGLPVEMHGVTTKITYRMLDENGRLLPE